VIKITLKDFMLASKMTNFNPTPKESAKAAHFLEKLGLIEIVPEKNTTEANHA